MEGVAAQRRFDCDSPLAALTLFSEGLHVALLLAPRVLGLGGPDALHDGLLADIQARLPQALRLDEIEGWAIVGGSPREVRSVSRGRLGVQPGGTLLTQGPILRW